VSGVSVLAFLLFKEIILEDAIKDALIEVAGYAKEANADTVVQYSTAVLSLANALCAVADLKSRS
jgi:hypothetical protein